MNLRDYQLSAVQRIRQAIKEGKRSILLVAPTGSGKTIIASHILQSANEKGRFAVFMAHRRELIKQCSDKLKKFNVPHAVFMAGKRPSLLAEIQVCSIQTFHARVTKTKRVDPPKADLVIIDEAHRSMSKSYLSLKTQYPNAVFIGLTATPCRSDGSGLGNFFDVLIEVSNPRELIDLGFLVPTRIVAPHLPDLRGLKLKQGDYENEELGKRMAPMIGNLVSDWEALAKDRKTVIFAVNVAHSESIRDAFYHAGYDIAHLDGETPTERRDKILSDLKTGKLQLVTNCQVLTEGWDEPSVSCVVLARPTVSYGLYLQMVGRVSRPNDGKTDSLVIDHAGSVYKHGFPQDSGGWELSDEINMNYVKDERLKKEPHPITCEECFIVFPVKEQGEHCPNCGCKPTQQAKAVMMEEGRLFEVKRKEEKKQLEAILNAPREASILDKAFFFGQLKAVAQKHRYNQGWAAHKYREKFGVWPNLRNIKNHPPVEPLQSTMDFIKHTQIRYAKGAGR